MRLRQSLVTLTCLIALVLTAGTAHASPGQEKTGAGSSTVALKKINESVIVEITFTGEGAAFAKPVLSNKGATFPWVDTQGPWSGSVFQEKERKPIVGAQVKTPGEWALAVKPLTSAPKVRAGTTSKVIRLPKVSKSVTQLRITFSGSGEFTVFPISAKGMSGFTVIDTTGPFRGKVSLPPGTKYLAITASGPWRVR